MLTACTDTLHAYAHANAHAHHCIHARYASLEMFAPKEYSGVLMELAQSRRGDYVDLTFINERRCSIRYNIPLAELITITM